MDDQLRQVKSGRELVNLDRVPNPSIPIPGHLRVPMPMMRPRFMPMMPVRGAPMPAVPGGLVMDPGAFAGQRMPMPHMPIPMVTMHVHVHYMYICVVYFMCISATHGNLHGNYICKCMLHVYLCSIVTCVFLPHMAISMVTMHSSI